MARRRSLGAILRSRGFDLSSYNPATKAWRVRCSQCQALVVNGVPTHEHGCPNEAGSRRPRFRDNPPEIVGEIPGRLLEIRYHRHGSGVSRGMTGFYKHPFQSTARMFALASGGILIVPKARGRKLWVNLPH